MHVKVEGKLFMGDWTEEREQPLAKWFTLRAILFYTRLSNSLDHSKIYMYYSTFQRKKCCPAKQPSSFWTL